MHICLFTLFLCCFFVHLYLHVCFSLFSVDMLYWSRGVRVLQRASDPATLQWLTWVEVKQLLWPYLRHATRPLVGSRFHNETAFDPTYKPNFSDSGIDDVHYPRFWGSGDEDPLKPRIWIPGSVGLSAKVMSLLHPQVTQAWHRAQDIDVQFRLESLARQDVFRLQYPTLLVPVRIDTQSAGKRDEERTETETKQDTFQPLYHTQPASVTFGHHHHHHHTSTVDDVSLLVQERMRQEAESRSWRMALLQSWRDLAQVYETQSHVALAQQFAYVPPPPVAPVATPPPAPAPDANATAGTVIFLRR